MRMQTLQARRDAGYTLIELITVLMVMAILVGMAAPALGSYVERQRVRRALDTVVGDIFFARMYAVRERRRVEVHFGPGSTYRFDTLNAAGTPATWRTADLSREFTDVEFPSTGAVTELRFDSRGLIDNLAGDGYLKVLAAGSRDSALISPAGRVYRAN